MSSEVVQTLVIEPTWKTESTVASTPVALLSTPAATSTTSPSAYTPTTAPGTLNSASSAGSRPRSQSWISLSSDMRLTLGAATRSVFVRDDNYGAARPSERTRPAAPRRAAYIT